MLAVEGVEEVEPVLVSLSELNHVLEGSRDGLGGPLADSVGDGHIEIVVGGLILVHLLVGAVEESLGDGADGEIDEAEEAPVEKDEVGDAQVVAEGEHVDQDPLVVIVKGRGWERGWGRFGLAGRRVGSGRLGRHELDHHHSAAGPGGIQEDRAVGEHGHVGGIPVLPALLQVLLVDFANDGGNVDGRISLCSVRCGVPIASGTTSSARPVALLFAGTGTGTGTGTGVATICSGIRTDATGGYYYCEA